MKTAIIMRGVPGSGKTTFAKKLAAGNHAAICSTDRYFVDKDGVYRHDPGMLKELHSKNLEQFMFHLKQGVPLVICDNTNIRYFEYEHYVKAAAHFDYAVAVVAMLPHPDPAVAAARSIHGVSKETIERMISRWEP